jgi:hypothetical protein
MSLIKHEVTKKQLAANRRNQKLSHGPATDEGRERIRAANLRHGFYAEAEEVALRALGEDPDHFQELVEGLWKTYDPTDAAQEGLVIQLARATWLMNRAVRMQEGYAVRQAQAVNIGRADRLHVQMMRLKMTAETLQLLAQSVHGEHYVTTPADLEMMKNLHQEGEVTAMGEIALALFSQLQAPGSSEGGVDPQEMGRRVANKIRAIFGVTPDLAPRADVASDPSPSPESELDAGERQEKKDARYPHITPAEWEARARPRQLLENILWRQVEICEAQRQATLKESLKGPSRYERAAEIAPTHPNARLMRRMQDSNFREVRRVTNLLLKIKRYERKMEASRPKEAEK